MKVRSAFVSDLHLGTRACKTRFLLDFLHRLDAEQLFLVGDVIDLRRLRSKWRWSQAHGEVMRRLVTLSRQGTRVYYIPGNHDEAFREYINTAFGAVRIRLNHVHELADGRKLLLLHGDEFDNVVRHDKLLGIVGAVVYAQLVGMNHVVNGMRGLMGMEYWSLAGYVKQRSANVLSMVQNFKRAACQHAADAGCDGVVVGHIHTPELDAVDGVTYCNTGDWVESCSVLTEDFTGQLSLVDWPRVSRQQASAPTLDVPVGDAVGSIAAMVAS